MPRKKRGTSSSIHSFGSNDDTFCPTPATTSSDSTLKASLEHHPKHDKLFYIRVHGSKEYLTLSEGKLQVVTGISRDGGNIWRCIKTQGWYGFQNTVSGTFIGHDGKGGFIARVTHHKPHEFFQAERHTNGGYLLLMRYGDQLRPVDIGEDGWSLVDGQSENTTWDFLDVDEISMLHCESVISDSELREE